MPGRINRRQFARDTSALASAGFWLGSQSNLAFGNSPNQRVNVACIGVGGKGSSDVDGAGRYGEILGPPPQVSCQTGSLIATMRV